MSWKNKLESKEKIEKELKNIGLTLLEENTSPNWCKKLKMIDEYGYLYYYSVNGIRGVMKKGNFIRKFDKSNPFTIENIDTFLLNTKSNTKLKTREYSGIKSRYEFICGKCGNIFDYSLDGLINSFHGNKNFVCQKCVREEISEIQRLSFNSLLNLFYENDLIPCFKESEYKNTQSVLKYKTKEGYFGQIGVGHLKRRGMKNVSMFQQNSPYFEYNLKVLCSKIGIKFNGIKEYKQNVNFTLLDVSCSQCGESFCTTKPNLLNGKIRCDKCTKKKSSLEVKTEKWLKENNIEFINQKGFSDLKYIHKLLFDFYVKSMNLLIECDGEFHYGANSLSSEKTFKYQKIRDKLKDDYCSKNNIKLLRIPYWEFKSENYKQILANNILNQK